MSTTDPNAVETTTEYDALDRVTKTTQLGASPAQNLVTEQVYDVFGDLVRTILPRGNVIEYGYDAAGRLVSVERRPDTSTHGERTLYTLDAMGHRAKEELQSWNGSAWVTESFTDFVFSTRCHLDRIIHADASVTEYHVGVPFSKGRLTAITCNGESVEYGYDRFGRVTADGELAYEHDANGNRVTIGYPGGVTATYTFDFADRESTLEVDDGVASPQPVVTSASYLPSGPLTALTLANGVSESRLFDARYFPTSIEVTTSRDHTWAYTTDDVGNPTAIVETEDCEPSVTLANETLTEDATIAACDTITADPNVTVAAGVEVTFQAGESIGLGNGFAVAATATFSAVIEDPSPVVSSRTFGYQDVQYFLTSADGAPWGALDWTYDKIGNRLTEERNTVVEAYDYLSNGTGNTAILEQARSRVYTTGPAGHVTQIAASANVIDLAIDDAGRVAGFERAVATAEVFFEYDGRSYLRRSEELLGGGPNVGFTEPTYSSDGLLHALHRQLSPSDPEERVSLLYFAGRPVAQLRQETSGPTTWLFLSTDHLGTPALATDLAGDEVWHGPLEPFGADFFRGSTESALAKGVVLRFPGQWEDETWEESTLGAEAYYNVFRWYQHASGRYLRPDPLGLEAGTNHYSYALSRPALLTDHDGRIQREPSSLRFGIKSGCAVAAFLKGRELGRAKLGWRYAHCISSCHLTRDCGLSMSAAKTLGILNEVIQTGRCLVGIAIDGVGTDTNSCHTAFAPEDDDDNLEGASCPVGESCPERCSAFFGRNKEESGFGPLYGVRRPNPRMHGR